MKINPLKQLETFGQSFWLDYIRRDLIASGELRRLIEEDGLRGITSNPSIFEKAIAGSHEYDKAICAMALEGENVAEIYEALSLQDVQSASDEFRPLYDEIDGKDGFVSLEVNPHLAHNTSATIEGARRLWAALSRPNVFIKVPATAEGIPAIRQLISEGISVNVTLLFGLPRYRLVAEAYISGIETRLAQGKPVNHVASVASFFVSRIDVLVDSLLEKTIVQGGKKAELAKKLRGQVAVASAKAAYQIYKEIFGSARFTIGEDRCSCPASALGQHRHQEPGLQRREIHRSAHRSGHGQHDSGRNPQCLPRTRCSRSPPRTGYRAGSMGTRSICRPRHQPRQGDATTRRRRR